MTTPEARAALGRAARKRASRASHGAWIPAADRADPVVVLERQAADRVAELLPIRYGRMAASPFAFLRGAAAIMAGDLATQRATGLTVQLCGDAHLLNFGLFASPERSLLFDVTDFDETSPGPFEWDVKRLAASVAVAARDNGHSDTQALRSARAATAAYRTTMRRLAGMGELAVWYEHVDAHELLPAHPRRPRPPSRPGDPRPRHPPHQPPRARQTHRGRRRAPPHHQRPAAPRTGEHPRHGHGAQTVRRLPLHPRRGTPPPPRPLPLRRCRPQGRRRRQRRHPLLHRAARRARRRRPPVPPDQGGHPVRHRGTPAARPLRPPGPPRRRRPAPAPGHR